MWLRPHRLSRLIMSRRKAASRPRKLCQKCASEILKQRFWILDGLGRRETAKIRGISDSVVTDSNSGHYIVQSPEL
jgi:hypothetical protein